MANKSIGLQKSNTPEQTAKILTKPLPQILDEMEKSIRVAGQAAIRAEEAARKAREAEEALRRTEETLVSAIAKKILSSWEMVTIIVLIVLGSVFAAVAISLGLSFGFGLGG